jgi:hypothetical protein
METLAHVAPSRKLHAQPVRLNPMRFGKVHEKADIHMAELDHLGQQEALRTSYG